MITSPDIGGVHIKYLYHCPRQLWLYIRGLRPEFLNHHVQFGEAVHDTSCSRAHPVDLGAARLDDLDGTLWVHEIKSSAHPTDADRAQALHCCYRLHEIVFASALRGFATPRRLRYRRSGHGSHPPYEGSQLAVQRVVRRLVLRVRIRPTRARNITMSSDLINTGCGSHAPYEGSQLTAAGLSVGVGVSVRIRPTRARNKSYSRTGAHNSVFASALRGLATSSGARTGAPGARFASALRGLATGLHVRRSPKDPPLFASALRGLATRRAPWWG